MQIPDIRMGDDIIDAVIVDEEAIEHHQGRVRGAKILYGKGALDRYLKEHTSNSEVCFFGNHVISSFCS